MPQSHVVLTRPIPSATKTQPTAVSIVSVRSLADRNSILPTSRFEGMCVYVASNQHTYQLIGGISNTNWTIFSSSAPTSDGALVRRCPYQVGDTELIIDDVPLAPIVQCYYTDSKDTILTDEAIINAFGGMVFGTTILTQEPPTSSPVITEHTFVDISLSYKYLPSKKRLVVHTPVIYSGIVVVTC